MARLASEIKFEGTLGKLSAYRMEGVDHIIIRRKGGPSKKTIETSPGFASFRLNMSEFGARSKATGCLNRCMSNTRRVADYNFTCHLNALLKPIQEMDIATKGQRGVLLTKNQQILQGFQLNRKTPFDSIVRNTVTFKVSREDMRATVSIPELIPELTFNPQQRFSMFSIVAELGIMPDIVLSGKTFRAATENVSAIASTKWFAVSRGCESTSLEIVLEDRPKTESFTLILSVAIRYGEFITDDLVQQVKRGGGAKILGVG